MIINSRRYNFIFLHLLSITVITFNLLTGLRIRLVSDTTLMWLSPILPQGQLHQLHLYSGIVLTAVALSALFLRTQHQDKKSTYHRWVNRLGYFVVIGNILSGWLKYYLPTNFVNPHLHYWFAIGLVAFLVMHALVHLMQQGRTTITTLLPLRKLYLLRFVSALSVVLIVTTIISLLQQMNREVELLVMPISYQQVIDIDGVADESFWQQAKATTLLTVGGANFVDGQTEITLKAVANPDEVYFLFTWQDNTQNITHLPLYKKDSKWFIKQDGFYQFDEQTFYEDKFAVMLSNTCSLGADGTAQLGPHPIKGKPSNFHQKGYHASLDGQVRDLWHWKAVRTNNMFLADDNHISAPQNVRSGERRYTAGYGTDGKESGAYVMNWHWYQQQNIIPKRLPLTPDLLTQYEDVNNSWVLPWFETKPYQASDDHYADGTQLPSVLYRSNRFEGDRADIRARGKWSAGQWTLELSRKRKTGSAQDVTLQDGICLWVSAFDHSQIAHTRHERPLKLVFSPW